MKCVGPAIHGTRTPGSPGTGKAEARGPQPLRAVVDAQGYRNGYEDGTVKTAEGVFGLQLPQVRGLREPSRAKLGAALGRTSDVLTRMIVERYDVAILYQTHGDKDCTQHTRCV